ncbi:BLUF domain-containing protein [Tropicibacter sp. S64]|uniref:BLUF domain-containing protein n=1 Tax=Tropicibacter sp. S64 TaxID=3415122 RepID=UPI003C7C895C
MSGQTLVRKIYISHARAPMSVPAIDVLLAAARENNARIGVTGFLAYHQRSFFQVIEGEAGAVAGLFAAIERDPRHDGIIELGTTVVQERLFGDWTMGYADPAQLGPENMAIVSDLRQLAHENGALGLGDRRVSVLLNTFLASFRDLAFSAWRVPSGRDVDASVPDQSAGQVA